MNPATGSGAHILVVDDDEDILRLLSMRLRARGFRVTTAASAEEALARIAVSPPRAVVSDVRLPGRDGLALFEEIRSTRPSLPVILLTAHGTIPDAVDATSRGVFGYLTKPFDSQLLLEKIDQALQLSAPAGGEDSADPRVSGGQADDWMSGMVFRSSRMAELMADARMVAASDASVLIRGESGTGKEVLARAIHLASPRAKGPFIAINCGAIPEQLLESELFGHVKGAFTGAGNTRAGLFQAANGGTLFLDEIGDMPLALQVKGGFAKTSITGSMSSRSPCRDWKSAGKTFPRWPRTSFNWWPANTASRSADSHRTRWKRWQRPPGQVMCVSSTTLSNNAAR